MSTASEQAAAFLAGTKDEAPGVERPATGEFARLRELLGQEDEWTDDEADEFADLAAKRRAGTLDGAPKRTVRKRASVAGERDRDGRGREREIPATASEKAAAFLREKGY
ncbi:MAG TPA: hypothetical protein DGU37_05530 [Microbacterium sp.]|nr:hypothetical protein [Microbacterium sp.]